MLKYPFTESDSKHAYAEWGANCGPNALAFALQIPLSQVRGKIPGFEQKHYTSPTMMAEALAGFGQAYLAAPKSETSKESMFCGNSPSLVRIQWHGPWTAVGANPKWAYRQTHWICTYMVHGQAAMVFDVNGGVRGYQSWRDEIVPLLVANTPRASGGWHPTHIWRIV